MLRAPDTGLIITVIGGINDSPLACEMVRLYYGLSLIHIYEDDAKLAAIEKSNGTSYGMYFDLGGIQIPLDFAFPAIAPWVIGAEIAESLEQFEEMCIRDISIARQSPP